MSNLLNGNFSENAVYSHTFEAPHFYLVIWHFLKSKNEISYNKP